MEKLQKVIDDKKKKSANTKPKYGMRKLSVGLVPVFLGAIVLIPGIGYAKEVSVATSAPRTEIVGEVLSKKDEKKDKEYGIQKVEAASTEQRTETTITKSGSSESLDNKATSSEETQATDSKDRKTPEVKTLSEPISNSQAQADLNEASDGEDLIKVLNEEEPATKKSAAVESEENPEVEEEKTETAQAADAAENNIENENIDIAEEKQAQAQRAGETAAEEDKNLQKADDPNYGEDEGKIKDYSESERYKETDLEPGDTNQEFYKTDEKEEKDGFKFELKNPSATSPSKTEYGYQITIDKKTGQRTYTKVYVTDSGLIPIGPGEKPMMDKGEKLTPESPDVTYNPDENTKISASRAQRNLNYEASEETLKHINKSDNDVTSFGMQDNYTQENPGNKFFAGNFALGYKVNPWPNENDKLEKLKFNKNNYDPNAKYFVQGQDIDTGIKVDNIDENAKERLVGQVYNPVTGKIVPGARAYIGDNGNIFIKMPEGALTKDVNGKTVVNEDSIFNTKDYKGLQNLDVKFFARPRTAEEFKTIAETPDEFGETGTYTETGAGTADINHKGTNVTIDKQGIDRYDHYNLIGDFKLNLDDTRYYDQSFLDGNNEDTRKNTSSAVKPGEPFEVKIYEPEDPREEDKSADEMNAAEDRGEAAGKVVLDFINKANEGKEDKDQWKVTLTDGDIGKFTITPPKSAKAGDFTAVPVEYTYTNGSKDVHWFHFVVQESDNYRPEYHAEIGYKGDTLTNTPDTIPEDTKKNKPLSYELVPGTYKDSAGNVWDNISVDPTTGVVTAVVPEQADIKGGENLYVDVKVNYKDEKTGEEKEETVKAQFIARPKYKEEVTKEFTSKIPFETKVIYDDTLEAGKVVKTEGVVGELKTSFKQIVINGEKGIINDDGEFVKGEEAVVVTTVTEKKDAEIRIGTKPAETKVEIPFETEYELDYTKKKGEEPTEITPGQKGEVTIKTTRDPETGEIKVTKEETKAPTKRKLLIPAGTEGTHEYKEEKPFNFDIEFDPNFYTNYPDAKDNYKVVTEGKVGEKTTKWKIENSKIVGEAEVIETDPTNAVIKVGQKDYTGSVKNTVTKEVPYKVRVEYNPNLEAGKTNVKQEGKVGSRTYEYTGEIVNGKLKDGTNFTEKELTDKYVEPTEHIIEIGTKPVENEKSVESEVGVDVEWVFDPNKDIGVIEVGDLIPGKVTTKTVNKYNPETGKIETTQETVVEKGKRKVVAGTKAYNGEFDQVDKDVIPYETEIVFDSNLKAGEKVIDQVGENGIKTTTTKHKIVNGEVVESGDPVTEVNKEAVKQIIKVGTMTDGTHSHTEKLPFETKVEVNPELKKGEWRYKAVDGVEQKGKLGSRTTKWTIVNSKVQDEKKVTEEKPIDAIIEVGSEDFTGEVKHKETFEIPFEVEVRYNKDLPAGTSKEIQKGAKGSYDVEYTQKIKNGQADGEMTKTESNKVEAKKHIIEIGTKVETSENNYSKDVEVEIEYVYDDTKDKGVVETGELTKGKVETKVVDKYNPETGKVEQTSEQVVTKAKQKVIVGTKDFTGTYEYKKTCPIPFEVEVREDPTLSKGEKKVDQEGMAGSKTTSYEQAIKNGKADGEAVKTGEETTKEPVKHIVRVGTKPLEGTRKNVVDKAIPYETKVIYDENLDAGIRVVDNEGKDGKEIVTTTITTKDGDITVNSEGKVIEKKEDRVVRVGVKPVVKEEAIPQDREYKHNPNLEAGTIKKISDGAPGKVTITTSFNKETGKLETKVTRTEPTNAKYEYGSKTTGTVKVKSDIPYEVEIIEDPTMDAGTHKVTQEGVVGEKETTIVVENSVEKSRTDKTTKEAVKKIIRVGTKPNENMCPVPEDPSIPSNPSNPGNNPNNPGTENPSNPGQEEPGKPGQEEPGKPGQEEPGKQGEETPDKHAEQGTPGSETPSNQGENTPGEPGKEVSNETSKDNVSNKNEASEVIKGKKVKSNKNDYSKAPKTFDAGIGGYAGATGLAGMMLAYLQKKKKEDQED